MRARIVLHACLLGLCLIAALIAFSPNLNSYFLSDDFVQIGKVLHGDFSVTWGQSHGGFFRPLFILSYIVDSSLWGNRPSGYHFTNIAVHSLNSLLLFKVGVQLLGTLALPPRTMKLTSAAAAALFLVHPSHTEAVIWISGRADLLATCFCLLSLWWYCRFVRNAQRSNLAMALAMAAVALLAKESAICLPFLVLIIGLYFGRGRKVLVEFRLFALLLAAFIVVRAWFLGTLIGGYGAEQHLNFAPGWIRDRLLEAMVRSVLPTLPGSWSAFLFKPLQSPEFLILMLAVVALLVVARVVRLKNYTPAARKIQNRFLVVMASLFVISLLPAINLRLSLYQALGERFLYLPTIFSCLVVSYVLLIIIRNQKVWLLIMICILTFYCWQLRAANQLWREAAQLTQSIRYDFLGIPESELTILNVPDSLHGVPVFHNGLPEALKFFVTEKEFQRLEIASFQTFESKWDDVVFQPWGDFFLLEVFKSANTFDRPSSASCLQLVNTSRYSLEFKPQPCLNKRQVYIFSDGKMRPAFLETVGTHASGVLFKTRLSD